jgi:uncharacterized protein involved in exopolysaccharide biosynthesis
MTERDKIFGTDSPVVLQMLLEEIKQARLTLTSHQSETREELRRIHDKIDVLRNEVRIDFQDHDRGIVQLKTQAEIAGRMSGFLAGVAATVLINAAILIVKYMMGTG